jgi:hypothetical protein
VFFPTVYFFLVVLASAIFSNQRAVLCKLGLFIALIAYLAHFNVVSLGVANTSNDAFLRVKEAMMNTAVHHRPVYVGSTLSNYHGAFMLKYIASSEAFLFRRSILNAAVARQIPEALYTEEARRELYPDEKEHHPVGGVSLVDYLQKNRHQLMLFVAQDMQARSWNALLVDTLGTLGLGKINSNLPKHPYIGISYRGKAVFEAMGRGQRLAVDEGDIPDLPPVLRALKFKLVSTTYGGMKKSYAGPNQGARSSIVVMGREYGKGIEGINVVVVDPSQGTVLSSKNFNANKGNAYSSDTLFTVTAPSMSTRE